MYSRFEQMLQEKGLTAYKVSKSTGIAQATFSDWKNGKSVPKLNKMIKIAEFLEVPLEWLQGTSEQKEKPQQCRCPDEERDPAAKAYLPLCFVDVLR